MSVIVLAVEAALVFVPQQFVFIAAKSTLVSPRRLRRQRCFITKLIFDFSDYFVRWSRFDK